MDIETYMKVMQEEGASAAQIAESRRLLEQLAIDLKIENILIRNLLRGGNTDGTKREIPRVCGSSDSQSNGNQS